VDGTDACLPLDFTVVAPGRHGIEALAFAAGVACGAPQPGVRLVLHAGLDAEQAAHWSRGGALCLPAARLLALLAPEDADLPERDPQALGRRYARAVRDLQPNGETLRLAAEALPADEVGLRALLQRALLHLATEAVTRRRAPTAPPRAEPGPLEDPAWRDLPPHALLERALEHLQGWRRADGTLPFEPRRAQSEMAHAVLDALLDGGDLAVEAGTGTGKTIAYALPALLLAATGERRFVLSTHTRNLQHQLVGRDLPELWRCFGLARLPRPDGDGRGLRFAKLLGRTNYLCRTALRRWARQAAGAEGSFQAAQLLVWSLRGGGELEDLSGRPGFEPRLLRELSSRREVCEGRACRSEPRCPVYAARDAARRADLVVVNHALLFSDGRRDGNLLGRFDGLVADECHHLEGVATDSLSVRLGRAQADALVAPLGRLGAGVREATGAPPGLRLRIERWGKGVAELRSGLLALLERLDSGLPRPARLATRQRYRDGDEVFGAVREPLYALHEQFAARFDEGRSLQGDCADAAGQDPSLADAGGSLELLLALQRETQAALEFLARGNSEDWAFYLEFGPDGGPLREIAAAPLDVAADIQRLLAGPGRGTVYTSATVALGAGFDYFFRRVGLRGGTPALVLPSPFDYASQCLVVQAQYLDGWNGPGYEAQVADLLAELWRRTGRRTLVLMTAHAALRGLHAGLQQRLGPAAPVLGQEVSGGRARLTARYIATPGAMLLGTQSFWEGVDFPGSALEILAIAKLPFLVPDEPLVAARCERLRAHGEDPFEAYVLPEAVLRFAQGFGRLVRTRHDRGVVLLLDSRLGERDYGDRFLAALPVRPEVFHGPDALLERAVGWLNEAPAAGCGEPDGGELA
jgi:Rad3-related DNA helicase